MPTSALTRRGFAALATAAALTGSVAACSSGNDTAAAGGEDTATITVLASTNVWADIVASVGGEHTAVEAIIKDPSADPHSYEYAPRDVAAVEDADMVVYNGGGYDAFIDSILGAISTNPVTVNAYELHLGAHGDEDHADEHGHEDEDHADDSHADDGHDHAHGSANEHVWYDFHTVAEVAEHVAEELAELAPQHADTFAANAAELIERIEALEDRAGELRATHQGTEVAQTEPLAGYLLDALGLVDVAPTAFTSAIENETDPPAAATAAFQDLLEDGRPALLVYNTQATSPATEQLRATAEERGIPVVEVTETLPAGMGYVQWMTLALDDLAAALSTR